jgi:hypothetical protein
MKSLFPREEIFRVLQGVNITKFFEKKGWNFWLVPGLLREKENNCSRCEKWEQFC